MDVAFGTLEVKHNSVTTKDKNAQPELKEMRKTNYFKNAKDLARPKARWRRTSLMGIGVDDTTAKPTTQKENAQLPPTNVPHTGGCSV